MTINAVAQAAAQGAIPALVMGRKITAVAALAGFVLRMFRRSVGHTMAEREQCGSSASAVRSRSDAGAIPERYGNDTGAIPKRYDVRPKPKREGARPGRAGVAAVVTKGGLRHG